VTGDEPAGILNPGAIDAVTIAGDGVVELHVEQTVPWDGSDHLLLLTQEKLYNYLTFVADGELERSHPNIGQRWRVVVDLLDDPDQRTADLLRRAGEEFHRLGGAFLTRRRPADR
jgi:Family of unknown function (DUF6572)